MTLAGKEVTFKEFATLRMEMVATSFMSAISSALVKYLDIIKSTDGGDNVASATSAMIEQEKAIDVAFGAFCKSALNEDVTCSYFDLSREEWEALQVGFFGGLPKSGLKSETQNSES